jgi:hypothetical protein
MTKVEGNPTRIRNRFLSSDRVVFVFVSAIIIGVLIEAGIIRVSGFVGTRDLTQEITVFIGLGIFSVFAQLIILNYVRNKVSRSYHFHNQMHIGVISKAIVIIQLGIIALLVVVLLEVSFSSSYHTILITVS